MTCHIFAFSMVNIPRANSYLVTCRARARTEAKMHALRFSYTVMQCSTHMATDDANAFLDNTKRKQHAWKSDCVLQTLWSRPSAKKEMSRCQVEQHASCVLACCSPDYECKGFVRGNLVGCGGTLQHILLKHNSIRPQLHRHDNIGQ